MYSNKLICQIINYINKNINQKISIDDLEKRFFYNRFYIMKLFKKEIGVSIIDYINYIRIYNSFFELKNSNKKIINIAYNNGFYSLEYFSELFKKIIGINPKKIEKYNTFYDEKVSKNISKIYNLKVKVNNYLSNQNTNNNSKMVLSIFKNKF